ncbi:hypothetical protein [Kitasatospora cheerisanensis]|uniref:Uncharacterized protein n=1 Tax=Kitasatospora cheerisanensis KCTC 2395 TaxID=1348663 RepID=A0A066YUS1_9ACTN|nr:hypothetical protein [Kitasatospora cheerisanensis]KDN81851.1 hypothetical protein KCH_65710 [Kitasatospora cheerisanensis KCTC 2395]
MEFTKIRESGAKADTPLGELTLHRTRSTADVTATMKGLEAWRLELDGRPLAELPRFGRPPRDAAALVHGGAVGGFAGAELRIDARDHLLRSGRFVEFRSGDRALRFVRRGLAGAQLLEDGRPVARTRFGSWEAAEPDPLRVVAMAVYAWANLDDVNTNPVLRNLVHAVSAVLYFF